MSLINKMLRDLDQRNAPAMDRSGMPSHLQPLPPEPRAFPLWIVPVLAVVAGASWFLLEGQDERAKPTPPPTATVVAPVPPPPAAPPQPPPLAAVIAPEAVEPPKADVPPVPAIQAPSVKPKKPPVAALRLETTLPSVKEKVAADAPAAAAKQAHSGKEVPQSPDPASIDKRPRTSSANDAADAEYRKAMTAVRRGAVGEATEKLNAVLRLDNRHVSARQALLSLLVEQQQWGEAQSLMEEGLALDPAQTGWAMALARLQLENGKLAEAAETLSRHARYAEQNGDYQAFQALLYQKQKRSREAAERYRAALAIKPLESRWWYGLGLALESDQKPQEAREAFLKARDTGNLPPELASAVEQRLR